MFLAIKMEISRLSRLTEMQNRILSLPADPLKVSNQYDPVICEKSRTSMPGRSRIDTDR